MDRRYTDYDVRNDPQLRNLAYGYLRQYSGTFQFMNECKAALIEQHTLPDQIVRAVLNTMLHDPKVQNMPTPALVAFDASSFARRAPDRFAAFDDEGVELPVAKRPTFINLPTRWHYPFGISNHPRSYVVHRVDTERSHGKLWMESWRIEWLFYWMCASHGPARPYEKTLALFSEDDRIQLIDTADASHIKHLTVGAKQRNWSVCRSCENADAS